MTDGVPVGLPMQLKKDALLSMERQPPEQDVLSHGELCESVYSLSTSGAGWSLKDFLGERPFRCFSYGRRALAEALRVSGVGEGDAVLLPGLICRDLLSALAARGATAKFYPVTPGLRLGAHPADLPPAKAVIAVNYFGFPQELSPFREYCRNTGAVLIEDNAHGLFSRDEQGRYLGTRGDLGIFSLRKTVPLLNGAALVVNAPEKRFVLNPQEPFDASAEPVRFRMKQTMRQLVPVVGHMPVYRLLCLLRRWKRFKDQGREAGLSSQAERTLPAPARPCRALEGSVRSGCPSQEVLRRRALYRLLDRLLSEAGQGAKPVFPVLPEHVVPYGYPFYARASAIGGIRASLDRLGLSSVPWPDLPDAIRTEAPEHYLTLWNVAFLW